MLIADGFEILAGHGRVETAKLLGLCEIAMVHLSQLTPPKGRAYVITDDRLAELAGWDRESLASGLKGLLELQFDDIENKTAQPEDELPATWKAWPCLRSRRGRAPALDDVTAEFRL